MKHVDWQQVYILLCSQNCRIRINPMHMIYPDVTTNLIELGNWFCLRKEMINIAASQKYIFSLDMFEYDATNYLESCMIIRVHLPKL